MGKRDKGGKRSREVGRHFSSSSFLCSIDIALQDSSSAHGLLIIFGETPPNKIILQIHIYSLPYYSCIHISLHIYKHIDKTTIHNI